MATVQTIRDGWRPKGRGGRRRRIDRLRERLDVETDPSARRVIEAQIAHFTHTAAPYTSRPIE
jgi:hypothetical protein